MCSGYGGGGDSSSTGNYNYGGKLWCYTEVYSFINIHICV